MIKIRFLLAVIIGKSIQQISRYFGYGGSALPGLIVEKIAPLFLQDTLDGLTDGVIVVVGTNGKTTTTKIISELLTSQGNSVLTNSSGSNFARGIIASILSEYSLRTRSLNKNIAVLEIDEAYGRLFVKLVKPNYVVALNVGRDQLDRYGELEVTTRHLDTILSSATDGCIINGDEPEFVIISEHLKVPVSFYGVNQNLLSLFPTDVQLLSNFKASDKLYRKMIDVSLEEFKGQTVSFKIGGEIHKLQLKLTGQYNFLNCAAALSTVRMSMPKIKTTDWLASLEGVKPAFGRGEVINIDGRQVELMLVKNPSNFRQVLAVDLEKALTMIAINDNYADGRDVSWLWDVDFSVYDSPVCVVSGIRANDMALRLHYDELDVSRIEANLENAINILLKDESSLPRRIFCTYTAMLEIRRKLGDLTTMEPGL